MTTNIDLQQVTLFPTVLLARLFHAAFDGENTRGLQGCLEDPDNLTQAEASDDIAELKDLMLATNAYPENSVDFESIPIVINYFVWRHLLYAHYSGDTKGFDIVVGMIKEQNASIETKLTQDIPEPVVEHDLELYQKDGKYVAPSEDYEYNDE